MALSWALSWHSPGHSPGTLLSTLLALSWALWGSLGKLETDFILPDSGGLAIRHAYEAQGYGANAYNA